MPVKRWWRSERISCTRDKSLTRQKRSPMRSFNLSALAVRERAITLFFIFAAACAGICLFSSGTRGRSFLYDQSAHGNYGVARSDCPGNAGSRGRAAGEETPGVALV